MSTSHRRESNTRRLLGWLEMIRDQFFEDLFKLGYAAGEPVIENDEVVFVFRDEAFTFSSAELSNIRTNNDPWRKTRERPRVFDYMTARVSDLRKLRKAKAH